MGPGGPEERALRTELVDRARALYERGLITALDGNLSVRFGGRWVLATPSGFPKAELTTRDLVLLDLGAEAARGGPGRPHPKIVRARRGLKPSSELAMHLAVYTGRADVGAVVHAHPPNAVGLTFQEPAPRLDISPESIVFLGEIGFAPYATPGTDALAWSVVPYLPHCDTILLKRHGALTVAPDLALAYQRMEALEHVARIYLAARQLGAVPPVPDAEQARLRALAGLPERRRSEELSEPARGEVEDLVKAVLEDLLGGHLRVP